MATVTAKKTITVEGTKAQVIPCTAREAFDFNGLHIAKGQAFKLVRSESEPGEYHLVTWVYDRAAWCCSCGAACKKHAHINAVNAYIAAHVVAVAAHKKAAQPVVSTAVQLPQAPTMSKSAPVTSALVIIYLSQLRNVT